MNSTTPSMPSAAELAELEAFEQRMSEFGTEILANVGRLAARGTAGDLIGLARVARELAASYRSIGDQFERVSQIADQIARAR